MKKEREWPTAPDPERPPQGKYLISFVRAQKVVRFRRNVIELVFVIVEPQRWAKTVATLYCGIPPDGTPSPSSKYYEVWTQANGGPAKKGLQMRPEVFEGYWWAVLDYTKRQVANDETISNNQRGRLIVVELLERAAGGAQPLTPG